MSLGFTKSVADLDLYYMIVDGDPLILVLYVYDLFIIGAKKLVDKCKR